ncbi:MAG: cell division topological specificity factor MinE [Syntrophomonas sp.]
MALLDFISRFFMKENPPSKEVARERLRLVLVHDRASVSPDFINQLKEDLIRVIQEYLDIDEDALQVSLENEEDSIALVANIPVKGLKRVINQ